MGFTNCFGAFDSCKEKTEAEAKGEKFIMIYVYD